MLMATIPSGFMNMSFSNNTYWRLEDASTIQFPTNTSDHSFAEWQHEGKDVTSAITNPQFVNAQVCAAARLTLRRAVSFTKPAPRAVRAVCRVMTGHSWRRPRPPS